MNRLMFTAAAYAGFALVATLAHAADAPVRRPAPVHAPARASDWSGGYLGVHGGLEADAFRSRSASPNIPALNFSGRKNTKSLGGGNLGVQAGYNWQSGNLVYGIEAEGSGLLLPHRKTPANLKPEASSRLAAKARLGHAFDNTLIYAAVGVAVSPQRYSSPAVGATPASRKSVTRVGPLLGVGMEHKITRDISLRGEIAYAFQARNRMTFSSGSTRVDSGAFSAKAGLNWHF